MRTAIFHRYVNDPTTLEVELHARSGQPCVILRPLGPDEADEEVGPMFRIRFEDGYEASAFAEELT